MSGDRMQGWKRIGAVQVAEMHREGWLGVWDAIMAAVTRRPRRTAPAEVTFSLWVKVPEGVAESSVTVYLPAAEIGPVSSGAGGR